MNGSNSEINKRMRTFHQEVCKMLLFFKPPYQKTAQFENMTMNNDELHLKFMWMPITNNIKWLWYSQHVFFFVIICSDYNPKRYIVSIPILLLIKLEHKVQNHIARMCPGWEWNPHLSDTKADCLAFTDRAQHKIL